ncbi:MAG: divergent PAP2 family protein [Lachnospiraceae bacterium]|nr:divergent PAP2 family protein [Candidatus Colinaster scatohippi]
MNYIIDLFSNYVLMTAIIGWASAQVIKTIIDFAFTKEFKPERLVGSGGMPSCHSATVCALTTAAGIKHGMGSFEFAVCCIFAIVVMYDARGVRRETGNQAEVLNQIMSFLKVENPGEIKFTQENLKELIGHTPLQVLIGAILGIATAFITMPLFF